MCIIPLSEIILEQQETARIFGDAALRDKPAFFIETPLNYPINKGYN